MSPSLCTPPFLCLRTSRDFASFCTELATPFPSNLTYIVVHIRFSSSVPVVTDILKRRHTPIICKYSGFSFNYSKYSAQTLNGAFSDQKGIPFYFIIILVLHVSDYKAGESLFQPHSADKESRASSG